MQRIAVSAQRNVEGPWLTRTFMHLLASSFFAVPTAAFIFVTLNLVVAVANFSWQASPASGLYIFGAFMTVALFAPDLFATLVGLTFKMAIACVFLIPVIAVLLASYESMDLRLDYEAVLEAGSAIWESFRQQF